MAGTRTRRAARAIGRHRSQQRDHRSHRRLALLVRTRLLLLADHGFRSADFLMRGAGKVRAGLNSGARGSSWAPNAPLWALEIKASLWMQKTSQRLRALNPRNNLR